jgi:hypothetical protein
MRGAIIAASVLLTSSCSSSATFDDMPPPVRHSVGNFAVRSACSGDSVIRTQRTAIAYLEFVRRNSNEGELAEFIERDTLTACARREGQINGRVSMLTFERGTIQEIQERIAATPWPAGFCEASQAHYGEPARSRIADACRSLNLES